MNFDQDPDVQKHAIQQALGEKGDEVRLHFRAMFGGIMAYAHGKPFASLSQAGLALNLSQDDQNALLEIPGARPLRYKPSDPPSKTYTLVPDAWINDTTTLSPYLLKSIRYVKR